jgi:hypothetical protein
MPDGNVPDPNSEVSDVPRQSEYVDEHVRAGTDRMPTGELT